jgi:hypothetical protein
MQDVVPFDRTKSWHALGVWEDLQGDVTDISPSPVMIMLLKLYGSYWLKSLLKSSTLLWWMIGIVDMYDDALDDDVMDNSFWQDAENRDNAIIKLQTLSGLAQILSRLLFDDELLWWTSNHGNPDLSIRDTVDACLRAIRIGEVIIRSLIPLPELRESMEDLVNMGKRISDLASRLIICTPELLEKFDLHAASPLFTAAFEEAMEYSDRDRPYGYMVAYAFSSRWTGRCFGPGCLKTVQEEGRNFASCSHCKHATYCSRKCQRTGWRHLDAPHRQVCELARQVALCKKHTPASKEFIVVLSRKITPTITPQIATEAARNFKALHESQFAQLRKCLVNFMPDFAHPE